MEEIKPLEEERQDLTAVIPRSVPFEIDGKEYRLIYNFKAIYRLEEMYESFQAAMDALYNDENNLYENIINFLYAGLVDRYELKKQEIEDWMGLATVGMLHNIVVTALLESMGRPQAADTESTEGEAAGGTTGM